MNSNDATDQLRDDEVVLQHAQHEIGDRNGIPEFNLGPTKWRVPLGYRNSDSGRSSTPGADDRHRVKNTRREGKGKGIVDPKDRERYVGRYGHDDE